MEDVRHNLLFDTDAQEFLTRYLSYGFYYFSKMIINYKDEISGVSQSLPKSVVFSLSLNIMNLKNMGIDIY